MGDALESYREIRLIHDRPPLRAVDCALRSDRRGSAFIGSWEKHLPSDPTSAVSYQQHQSLGILIPGYHQILLNSTDYQQARRFFAQHCYASSMDTQISRGAGLTGLPMEILLDVYRDLDISSIYNLALACRSFRELFTHRKATILLPALAREFSPFDELLQIYTASADDLGSTYGSLYMPRRIIFKRFDGDAGIVLASGSSGPTSHRPGFTQVVNGRKPGYGNNGAKSSIVLTDKDFGSLLGHCQLVRKWEQLFPSMRWFYDPASCRILRPHEAERFRRAFYRWWLYGIYFHGELPRPRVGLPEPHVDDIRISQMRHHSTSELLELMDLVETMKDVILHYICPRLDPNQQNVSSSRVFTSKMPKLTSPAAAFGPTRAHR